MNRFNTTKGFLYASLGSIGWGISGVCSQSLFMNYDLSSEWLTAIRMVCSGVVLLLLTLPKAKSDTFRIWTKARDVLQFLAFALIGLLLCQYTFLGAIKYSNSATATVLQSLNVILMAVLMAVWSRTHMSGRQLLAILLAMAGTFLIATNGDPARMSLSTAGLILGLLAALGVVTYTLLSRPIIASWGNLTVTGWGMLIGCLEPASATALSALFLGTRFSLPELTGFCFIILTVFLSVTGSEKQS